MVFNKKVSVISKLFCDTGALFLFKNFWNNFVFSIISSHVITELSIILAKYLPFSQLHIAGF